MEKANTERLVWIDICKAFLIFTMVLGHAGAKGWERDWFYAFHMPAFFIISGYLYKPHAFVDTVKSLFIPVTFFSIINISWGIISIYIRKGETDILDFLSCSWQPLLYNNDGTLHTPFPGIWFIMVLFFSRFLLGDISKVTFVRKYLFSICWICLIASFILQNFDIFKDLAQWHIVKLVYCFPFLGIGIYIKEHKETLLALDNRTLFLLFVSYVGLCYYNSPIDLHERWFGKDILLLFLNACIASLLLFNLTKKIKNISESAMRSIRLWSDGTLVILGIHFIIIDIYHILCDKKYIEDFHVSYLLLSCLIMLVSLPFIHFLIKKYPEITGKAKKKLTTNI